MPRSHRHGRPSSRPSAPSRRRNRTPVSRCTGSCTLPPIGASDPAPPARRRPGFGGARRIASKDFDHRGTETLSSANLTPTVPASAQTSHNTHQRPSLCLCASVVNPCLTCLPPMRTRAQPGQGRANAGSSASWPGRRLQGCQATSESGPVATLKTGPPPLQRPGEPRGQPSTRHPNRPPARPHRSIPEPTTRRSRRHGRPPSRPSAPGRRRQGAPASPASPPGAPSPPGQAPRGKPSAPPTPPADSC
jgi:hypothetical protein